MRAPRSAARMCMFYQARAWALMPRSMRARAHCPHMRVTARPADAL